MAISDEITRLQNAKAALKTSIEGKGVTVSSDATLDDYPALVDSIETGGGVSDNVWYIAIPALCYNLRLEYNDELQRYDIASPEIRSFYGEIWFEYQGEKYYAQSVNDGDNPLSKEGQPVVSSAYRDFLEMYIYKNTNDVWVLHLLVD